MGSRMTLRRDSVDQGGCSVRQGRTHTLAPYSRIPRKPTWGGLAAPPYDLDANGVMTGSRSVHKVGRTTGSTEGEVVALGSVVTVPYPSGKAYFVDQIMIRPSSDNGGHFSLGGDSGSGVLNDAHEAVGLVFAGSDRFTLANPIHHVLQELRTVSGRPSLALVCSKERTP